MNDNTRKKQVLAEKLAPDLAIMGEPTLLTGTEISTFSRSNNLHLIEASMALGVNTAALYTKKSADSINSTLSLLLRLYSAFPEYLPRIQAPEVETLLQRIMQIDPSFKATYLGPLLGLETNSSFRIKSAGLDASNPMVRSLAQLINLVISADPQNWFVIKDAVEIEAKARGIFPSERVWSKGGWSAHQKGDEKAKDASGQAADTTPSGGKVSSTAKQLVRRAKM